MVSSWAFGLSQRACWQLFTDHQKRPDNKETNHYTSFEIFILNSHLYHETCLQVLFNAKKDILHCSVKLRFNLDYVQIICMNQFSMANKTQKHPLFISPCIMQQHGFSSYPGQRWRSLGVSADFIIARVVLKSTFTPKGKNKVEYSFHFNSSQIKFDYLN